MNAKAPPDERQTERLNLQALTAEQKALAARHIGLVGLHLRRHVPRPKRPRKQREYEDLFQEGCMALIRAAVSYDPRQHGDSFPSYVLPRIRAAVHTTLHEYFLTIRVPTRANQLAEARRRDGDTDQPTVAEELTYEIARHLEAAPTICEDEETLWHAIRQRYQRAVRLALADMRLRTWHGPDAIQIIERIAEQRLLVSHPQAQISLRRLAREFGTYLSRIGTFEGFLLRAIRHHFSNDPQLPQLIRFAREDARGFAGRLDAERRRRLLRAELRVFADRFGQLSRSARAELVYAMIERSTATVTEVACNLYRLTHGPAPTASAHVA